MKTSVLKIIVPLAYFAIIVAMLVAFDPGAHPLPESADSGSG